MEKEKQQRDQLHSVLDALFGPSEEGEPDQSSAQPSTETLKGVGLVGGQLGPTLHRVLLNNPEKLPKPLTVCALCPLAMWQRTVNGALKCFCRVMHRETW